MMKDRIESIGFIGAGNMGSAIISRLAGSISPDRILVFDADESRAAQLKKKFNINKQQSIEGVCAARIIVIAVKPDTVSTVLESMKPALRPESVVVSIAAGVQISSIEKIIGADKKIARIMPNTPAMAGEGMSVIALNGAAGHDDRQKIEFIFSHTGKTAIMPEKMMDAVTGLSGSGPAYVFTFIQALADGGVKMGLPRENALLLAAQTVLGSAKLVLESGEDPITLRSRVASPGGTTIEGIHVLEKAGFSGTVMDAVEAATVKSKKLGER